MRSHTARVQRGRGPQAYHWEHEAATGTISRVVVHSLPLGTNPAPGTVSWKARGTKVSTSVDLRCPLATYGDAGPMQTLRLSRGEKLWWGRAGEDGLWDRLWSISVEWSIFGCR